MEQLVRELKRSCSDMPEKTNPCVGNACIVLYMFVYLGKISVQCGNTCWFLTGDGRKREVTLEDVEIAIRIREREREREKRALGDQEIDHMANT